LALLWPAWLIPLTLEHPGCKTSSKTLCSESISAVFTLGPGNLSALPEVTCCTEKQAALGQEASAAADDLGDMEDDD
jgi:hypothetical protein